MYLFLHVVIILTCYLYGCVDVTVKPCFLCCKNLLYVFALELLQMISQEVCWNVVCKPKPFYLHSPCSFLLLTSIDKYQIRNFVKLPSSGFRIDKKVVLIAKWSIINTCSETQIQNVQSNWLFGVENSWS